MRLRKCWLDLKSSFNKSDSWSAQARYMATAQAPAGGVWIGLNNMGGGEPRRW